VADPALSLQVLGGFRLLERGSPIVVPSERVQALLTYLVLRRGVPQHRAHLASLFWPDSTDRQARTNLRKLVLELRRTLPDADRCVRAEGGTLLWREEAPCTVDVLEFERAASCDASVAALERAAALYAGDLLPGCYDEWVLAERERLRQRYLTVLERLVALLEARRAYAEAIACARRLLDQDPLREATYRWLMRLHAVVGDRAGAMRVYHTCATLLERELGVPPGAATREAYERLVHADVRPQPAPLVAPRLIGREGEWARILAAWQETCAGCPRVLLLSGEAGIGKTRLMDEMREWAVRQGIATAAARGYAAEGGLAYAPVAALLRSRPLPSMDTVWRTELARILPEVARSNPALPPLLPLREGWQRRRLFEGLARAILATQPLLLTVDDLQWCDEDSLAWFHYLVRYDPRARVLLCAAYRPEELDTGHPLRRVLAAWRNEGVLSEIEVEPLRAEVAGHLAQAITGEALDEEATRRLLIETGGNPLFIIELARAGMLAGSRRGEARLPVRVEEVIRARLAHLSPAARETAEAAAVIGTAFTVRLLIRIAGGDEAGVVRGVDELWRRRILRESGQDAYDFSHDVVRGVVAAGASRARRQWLHRRTAEALEVLHAPDLDSASGEIAAHLEAAGLPERAAPYYRRAAEAARRVYALEVAATYYDRLLSCAEGVARVTALRGLGDVRQCLGRLAEAEAAYRRALALAEDVADEAERARCRTALGLVVARRGGYQEALSHLERARRAREALGDRPGLSETLLHTGIVYWHQDRHEEARACFEQVCRIARETGDTHHAAEAVGHMGLVYHHHRREHERALECFEQHLALARQIDDRPGIVRALNNAGHVHKAWGNYPRAVACYADSLALALAIGDRRMAAIATGNLGTAYQDPGEDQRAVACYVVALEWAAEVGDRWHAAIVAGNLARARMDQDDAAGATRALAAAVTIGRRLGARYHLCKHLAWQAELALRRGCPAEAVALAGDAARMAADVGRSDIQFDAEMLLVRARVAAGDPAPPAGIETLEQMLERWPGEREQAALRYEMWRLAPAVHAYRRDAARRYRALYQSTPHREYRRRYSELTGETLPPPPSLAEVPDLVLRHRVDIFAAVTLIEQIAAELEAVPLTGESSRMTVAGA
jgi:DNA-binding SARP family transcriptional activator